MVADVAALEAEAEWRTMLNYRIRERLHDQRPCSCGLGLIYPEPWEDSKKEPPLLDSDTPFV